MENTITGAIKLINDTQVMKNDFSKREFVITTDEKYSQDIKFEVVKDKCKELDSYKEGDIIEVSFNIRGNEYQGKYYVNLVAWKITHVGEHQDQRSEPIPTTNTLKEEMPNLDEMDSIPF